MINKQGGPSCVINNRGIRNMIYNNKNITPVNVPFTVNLIQSGPFLNMRSEICSNRKEYQIKVIYEYFHF